MKSDDSQSRRMRGERGTAIITVTVLLFTFTFGTILWLSRDVNRVITNESAAQSIAFQAARAGAQQVATGSLRGAGAGDAVVLDVVAARIEAERVADRLYASYGLGGTTEIAIDEATATVTVTATVDASAGVVSATGSAQAQTEATP